MSAPLVSICLPNLNTLRFLPERFDTIFRQSLQHWELLVYDSYSDDGAWEYIQKLAAQEPRMKIWQGPREGTPGSWSPCIREARGKYVYVATSDDTMADDCLEKLVTALENHPGCDVAHCTLREVDEHGLEVPDWWSTVSLFALSSGDLVHRHHLRQAPLDGLLHLCGLTTYTSVTQLLIRRSLFDKIGYFERKWGSVGDFHWNMRAGLVANAVHVPDTWAGWRTHSTQATASAGLGGVEHMRQIDDMIEDALATTREYVISKIPSRSLGKLRRRTRDLRHLLVDVRLRPDAWSRRLFLIRRLLRGSWAARWHVSAKLKARRGIDAPLSEVVLDWLQEQGITSMLVPVDRGHQSTSVPIANAESATRAVPSTT